VKLITVVTQPRTFEAIKEALALFGVREMIVAQVDQVHRVGPVQFYRGREYTSDTTPSLRIDLIVADDEAPDLFHIIDKILSTTDPDYGILWYSPADLLARIRTSECGRDAL
jgi:nitrogen regulatory protein P-II 1